MKKKVNMNSESELDPVIQQREYYTKTAKDYDNMRRGDEWALRFAEFLLLSIIDYIQARTLLEVGAGTGRTLAFLKSRCPKIRLVGIEPVTALREVAFQRRNLLENEIIAGDGANLDFPDHSFDLVAAIGVLHHVAQPSRVIAEMLRVAKKGVFICDVNNIGHGPWIVRRLKGIFLRMGFWQFLVKLRTGGKGYYLSNGDGLAYSYSIFKNLAQIEKAGFRLHLMNMGGRCANPFYDAPGAVVIGIKEDALVDFP